VEPIISGDSGSLRDGKDELIAEVALLASEHGIRVLRGGGTVFAHHGLISPRVSPSTAFIVDPAALGALVGLLEHSGWRVSAVEHPIQLLPPAIVRLRRKGLDGFVHLHGVIPGFFADPEVVFDVMWGSRGSMIVNGVRVSVLDRLCTVILAAHDRLDGRRYRRTFQGDNFAYFVSQFRSALTAEERQLLTEKVGEFGADDELHALLDGLALPVGATVLPSESYVRFRMGLQSVTPGDIWIIEHLERPRVHRKHDTSVLSIAAAVGRLPGARRRITAG
jgi:hypothetical protein